MASANTEARSLYPSYSLFTRGLVRTDWTAFTGAREGKKGKDNKIKQVNPKNPLSTEIGSCDCAFTHDGSLWARFWTSLEKKLSCRHQGKGPRLYTAAEAESKGLVERSPGLWATATWVEKRPLNIIWTDRGYNMGLGLLMAAFASLYGLRAKALDPPLNPPTVRLSVLLSLKTTEGPSSLGRAKASVVSEGGFRFKWGKERSKYFAPTCRFWAYWPLNPELIYSIEGNRGQGLLSMHQLDKLLDFSLFSGCAPEQTADLMGFGTSLPEIRVDQGGYMRFSASQDQTVAFDELKQQIQALVSELKNRKIVRVAYPERNFNLKRRQLFSLARSESISKALLTVYTALFFKELGIYISMRV
ncbi:hypothetical protein Tco_0373656 [Tanacetum coccineum]